ncbi:dopamine D2-like receptor [Hydractinia symbiolongicarpus]|uniref:dopamine D2-like receptor n=1 Tax=Hydractinia symbiolongicarpus TaxID=13093 RepID=UPI00255038A2|nr:dopamine D2-like receptor [Hydractinia symbiolongicarpus]
MPNNSSNTDSPGTKHVSPYILLALCSIALIENIFVCFMILNYRRLRTATNVFIFGLCTTNVLCAGVLLPTHSMIPNSLADKFLTLIVILTYINNLTAVTFERYIAISRPLRYHQIITKKRAVRIIIFCYIEPLIYCVLPFAWEVRVDTVIHKVYVTFTLALFLITPLVFILGVYAKVCHTTHKFFKKHSKLIVTSENNSGSELWEEAKFLCCLHKSKLRDDDDDSNSDNDDDDKFDDELSLSDKDSPIIPKKLNDENRNGLKSVSRSQNGVTHKFNGCNHANKNGEMCKNGDTSNPIIYPISDLVDIYEHESAPGDFLRDNKRKISRQRSLGYLEGCNRNINNKRKPSLVSSKTNDTILVMTTSSIRKNEYVVKKYPLQSSISFEGSSILPKKILTRHDSVLSEARKKQNYYQKRRSSTLRTSTRSWVSFNNKAKQMLTELKASLAFALVVLTYMFTWLPVVYMSLLEVIGRTDLIPVTLTALSTYTIGLNAMVDPLLYGIMIKEFRQTIKSIMRKRKSIL